MNIQQNSQILSVPLDDFLGNFLRENPSMVISLQIYKLPPTRSRKTVYIKMNHINTTTPQMLYLKIGSKFFSYNFSLNQGTKILDIHLTLCQVCP